MFELIRDYFKSSKNENQGIFIATQDGIAVPLTEVPDKIISEGILGNGVAIIPRSGKVVAPVSGKITSIAKSGHAFCIQTKDGLDVLIHIGVDTVKLNGKGFKILVKAGQMVSSGKPICDVDLSMLKTNNLPSHTAIMITNPVKIKNFTIASGVVKAGSTVVIQYELIN